MMKKSISNLFVTFCIALLAMMQACAPAREIAYITDAERDSAQQIIASYANSIHKGDQLYIYVYSQTPESVIPFNQETHKVAVEMSHVNMVKGNNGEVIQPEAYKPRVVSQIPGYLVDDDGSIAFPVLGKIHVEAMSYDSLQTVIQQRLIAGDYLYDPVVTVSPMNFRVSVLGEVRRPRELHIIGDRLTLLEALAMCGDLTVYGVRESVIVVREKNGTAIPIVVDLTKKTLFDSECYYLQHNDIVYVEPNMKRKRRANYDQNLSHDILSYVRLSGAVVRLGYASYRRYVIDRRGLFD